jgi:TPP-dependent pyruvate/acetoin dehydrogenase alpha subunit
MCKIVTEAADFAQNDPLPDVSELWTDVMWTRKGGLTMPN